ncbi:MAG: branched-chain amino acid ABC transporter permease [Pseudomonadota bacterium]
MGFELIAQSIIFGIFVGALYGLAAVGFSFVFGVMRILNIAHGEFIMLGGYAGFLLFSRFHIDPFLSLPLVGGGLFFLGIIFYKLLFSHVIKFSEELRTNTSLLVSFGLILILEQGSILIFTADERGVTPFYSGRGVEIFNVHLPYVRLGILIVSVILIFGLQLFLNRTYVGKSIRAAAENWESATLMGINITRTYLIAFGLACALAGVAGSMVAVGYSVNPAMGLEWILKAMVVSILAGVGSVGGAFVAGVMLGVVEAVTAIYLGAYMQVVGLGIFLLVLMLKPQGLFGREKARV